MDRKKALEDARDLIDEVLDDLDEAPPRPRGLLDVHRKPENGDDNGEDDENGDTDD